MRVFSSRAGVDHDESSAQSAESTLAGLAIEAGLAGLSTDAGLAGLSTEAGLAGLSTDAGLCADTGDVEAGEFADDDRRYLRALYRRLKKE
ncbi:MAG: hypothetical protein Q7J04_08720 [Microcella sp.]|nr:hypothetical protein [Microcella sp.]